MKLNYDLMRVAQINSAMYNNSMKERENSAEKYIARNKEKGNEENPSDFQLILAGLCVPLAIMAAYFLCCLF